MFTTETKVAKTEDERARARVAEYACAARVCDPQMRAREGEGRRGFEV